MNIINLLYIYIHERYFKLIINLYIFIIKFNNLIGISKIHRDIVFAASLYL